MNPELRYYWSVFVRRMPVFILVTLAFAAAGGAVASLLPTKFTARALMLVEAQQIPTDMVATTVRINPRQALEVMQQRLMTRSNVIDIAREFEVYEDVRTMNADSIVGAMRDDTRLNSIVRNQAILMEVQFSARTADIAAQVANEYVTRILAENARERMRLAEDTLAFFEQEVERLEKELEQASSRILQFQNQNADALPSTLDARIDRRDTLSDRLEALAVDMAELADRRDRLIALYDRTGEVRAAQARELSPLERQLVAVRQELNNALAVYSEQSPQVRILRARLDQLEEQAEASPDAAGRQGAGPARLSDSDALDLQLREMDAELARLERVKAELTRDIERLDDTIERTPANVIALEELQRDYENLQGRHDAALQRLATAQTGQRIELLSKGERITVLEQAVPPNNPDSPNRVVIAGGGLAFGMIAGLGLIALLEFLDRSVRRPVDLTRGLGITPLVSIPYIQTRGERIRRRVLLLALGAFVLAGIPGALYFVHYEVMPLDLALERAMARVGL